jgi:hypothetical protein
MNDYTLCKLSKHDQMLFKSIISDVFHGVVLPDINLGELSHSIDNIILQRGWEKSKASNTSDIIDLNNI